MKTALLAVLFILLTGGGFIYWALGRPRLTRTALTSHPAGPSFPWTNLEKALPEGPLYVVGGRDIFEAWSALRRSRGYDTLWRWAADAQKKLPFLVLPSGRDSQKERADIEFTLDHCSRRPFVFALYKSTRTTALSCVLLISLPEESTTSACVKKRLDEDFHRYIKSSVRSFEVLSSTGVWGVSNNKFLFSFRGEGLDAKTGAPSLLQNSAGRIPLDSKIYFAFDMSLWTEYLRSRSVAEAMSSSSPPPFSWAAGGLTFKDGVRLIGWNQTRENMADESFFKQPPRSRRLAGFPSSETAFFASVQCPLSVLWGEILKSLKDPAAPVGKFLKAVPSGISFDKDILPHLGDEFGLYWTDVGNEGFIPPVALFSRLKWPGLGRLLERMVFSTKNGWAKEGPCYVLKGGHSFPGFPLMGGVRGGFVFIGTKPAVEWILKKADGPSAPPTSFQKIIIPEKTSSLQAIDLGKMVRSMMVSLQRAPVLGEKMRGNAWMKMMDWSEWLPRGAGYSVNYKEGVFSEFHWDFKDPPQELWNNFLSTSQDVKTASTLQSPVPAPAPSPAAVAPPISRSPPSVSIPAAPSPTPTAATPSNPSPFHAMLQDKDWMVRRDAVKALGNSGDKTQGGILKKMTKDASEEVRREAKESLRRLGVR